MDKISTLRRPGERKLQTCVRDLITKGYHEEIDLPYRDSPNYLEAFLAFYDNLDNKLKRRVKKAVARLISDFDPNTEPLDYFSDLLVIAGRKKVSIAHDTLIEYGKDEIFKGKVSRDEDLHYCILDVLIDARGDHHARTLFERDINDPRYISACFQGLSRVKPSSAKEHVGKVIRHYAEVEDGDFLLSSVLEDFVEHTGTVFLRSNARYFSETLSPKAFETFTGYIGELCPEAREVYASLAKTK